MTPFKVEVEQEDDGRWIAEVVDVPGAMAYGETREEAVALATRIANNEAAILAEPALSDWLRPEEEEAWQHLKDLPELEEEN